MGTSGSFSGSGGKDAGSLRDAISGWLDSQPTSDPNTQPATDPSSAGDASSDSASSDSAAVPSTNHLNPASLAPAVRLWGAPSSSRSSSGSGGSTRSRSSGGGTSGGRSSGGVRRTVSRVAGPAGRAGSLALAYSTGNRQALEAAGLNYDQLRTLDPLAAGQQILAIAFEGQPDGTIEDSESRMIVAELVSWILEAPEDHKPEPDEIVRHSIELMIAQATLTEVGETIRKDSNPTKRREAEVEIKRGAQVMAAQITLNGTGATAAEITTAIAGRVDQLVNIYKDSE